MGTDVRLDVAGVREDDESAGDALGALQQRQGLREDVVAIFGGEERQTDRHGERSSKSSEKVVATAASKT